MFNWEKEFTHRSLEEAITRGVAVYGIEGAEDKAKEILVAMPEFQCRYLDTLYNMYNFGCKDFI